MSLDKLKVTVYPGGTISDTETNYQYVIKIVDEVQDTLDKPATTFTLPGKSYKNNQLIGITGQEDEINIYWNLHNDGSTDYADGSYHSTINTMAEQIKYLKNTIHDASFSASWTLVDNEGIYGTYSDPDGGLECHLKIVDIPTFSQGSPRWREATMTIIPGEMVI